MTAANPTSKKIVYNPKNKDSVAYFINNRTSEYIDTSYFTKHQIEVPIYNNKIIYGKEIKTKKYSVLLSAPNMYEMFSAQPQNYKCTSYWMLNTSEAERIGAAVYNIGVPINIKIDSTIKFNIRVVGFIKNNTIISSGDGTVEKPYIIK